VIYRSELSIKKEEWLKNERALMQHNNPLSDVRMCFFSPLKNNLLENYIKYAIINKEKKLTRKVIYFYKKALFLRIRDLGRYNQKTVVAYMNLAEAYLEDGQIEKSLKLYEQTLKITKSITDKDSLYLASIYNALGNLHFLKENFKETHSFYSKALNIREEQLGEMHTLTAKSNYELGYFYAFSQEYSLALPFFEKALKCRVELYRLSHPETANSYNSLAMCQYHLFQYEEAYKNLQEAIKIQKIILPKNDIGLLSSKKNLKEIKKEVLKKKKETLLKSFILWMKSFVHTSQSS